MAVHKCVLKPSVVRGGTEVQAVKLLWGEQMVSGEACAFVWMHRRLCACVLCACVGGRLCLCVGVWVRHLCAYVWVGGCLCACVWVCGWGTSVPMSGWVGASVPVCGCVGEAPLCLCVVGWAPLCLCVGVWVGTSVPVCGCVGASVPLCWSVVGMQVRGCAVCVFVAVHAVWVCGYWCVGGTGDLWWVAFFCRAWEMVA